MLERLLSRLAQQKTNGLFTYSVHITDNDPGRSAEPVVVACAREHSTNITYNVEPRQNIALARNKSLEEATGDLIAIIDDDELPSDDWLLHLFKASTSYDADGVLGPVRPCFPDDAPDWVRKKDIYDARPNYPTGYLLSWIETRTANVLFERRILEGEIPVFNPIFEVGGEDLEFFRRVMRKGFKFVWCNEAPVDEIVFPQRCTRSFLLKRALLRGQISLKHDVCLKANLKAALATLAYAIVLPFLIADQHAFMKYAIKFCNHAGRLFALAGFSLVKGREA